MVTEEDLISETAVWPYFIHIEIVTALKGTHLRKIWPALSDFGDVLTLFTDGRRMTTEWEYYKLT